MKEQNANLPRQSRNFPKNYRHSQNKLFKVKNHTIFKCKNERNQYIAHEVHQLIKKQLVNLDERKKIEKILQNQPKDIVFSSPKTPQERVNQFRTTQRQKQWERLKNFKVNNQERMRRLEEKFKEKSMSQQFKSTQNLFKFERVHQNYETIQEKNNQKIQELKKQLLNRSDNMHKQSSVSEKDKKRFMHSSVIVFKKGQATGTGTKEEQLTKQQKDIRNCIIKLKTIQQRKLLKELKQETRRSQKAKISPKITIATRIYKQQQLMNQWNSEYLKRVERHQKNYNSLCQEKQQVILQVSQQKCMIKQQVLQRKHLNEEKIAQNRMKFLQKKLQKINNIPNRKKQQQEELKSRTNYLHNYLKSKEDERKQEHNEIMRKIYNVIQKLKRLGNNQKLSDKQVALLLQNLNCGAYNFMGFGMSGIENSSSHRSLYNNQKYDWREIIKYISTTKQKFMQQKQKQQQEKNKKNKKNNTKIL